MVFFFFFFQAEDGIRDYKVTGVQTCALPIYARQKLEELKNRCYCDATAFPASTGTDAPEAGVTRSWTVTQAGATTAPNRLSQITVTVTWTSGSSATGGQQVIMQTMRAE